MNTIVLLMALRSLIWQINRCLNEKLAHHFYFVFFYVVLVFDGWLNDLWVSGNDMYLIMTIREKDEYTLDLAIKKESVIFFL